MPIPIDYYSSQPANATDRMIRFRRRRFRGRKLNKRQKFQVKRLIRNVQELKYFEGSSQNADISTSPAILDISAVSQGDTDTTRDGDRLQWVGKIDFRYSLDIADATNIIRVMIFQWKPNSSPAAGSLFLNGPTGAVDVWSNYGHDHRQEYTILYDKTYSLVGNGGAATVPTTTSSQIVRFVRISLKRIAKMAQFTAGTTAGTNKLYLYLISDSALVGNPTITFSAKVFFRDS